MCAYTHAYTWTFAIFFIQYLQSELNWAHSFSSGDRQESGVFGEIMYTFCGLNEQSNVRSGNKHPQCHAHI